MKAIYDEKMNEYMNVLIRYLPYKINTTFVSY